MYGIIVDLCRRQLAGSLDPHNSLLRGHLVGTRQITGKQEHNERGIKRKESAQLFLFF